jgi:hypothetical protein
MQRFEYRYPRFSVDLPAQFSTASQTLAARCMDISATGVRLNLPQASLTGDSGTVSLRYHNQTIVLKARVAHGGLEQSGLEFLYSSTAERNRVADFVASLESPHSRSFLSLVPRINTSLRGPAQH